MGAAAGIGGRVRDDDGDRVVAETGRNCHERLDRAREAGRRHPPFA